MKIIFTTEDGSKYLYKIIKTENSKAYKSWLETLSGNRNAEFMLDALTPLQSIQELKPILNEKGFSVENVESVKDSFFSEEHTLELLNQIKG